MGYEEDCITDLPNVSYGERKRLWKTFGEGYKCLYVICVDFSNSYLKYLYKNIRIEFPCEFYRTFNNF